MLEKIKENKLSIILGITVFLLTNYLSYYFRVTFANDILTGFNLLFEQPQYLFYAFPLSLDITDITVSLVVVGVGSLFIHDKKQNKKKFRKGVEHGSAEWGIIEKELKGMYDQGDQFNNIIMSKNIKIRLDDKNTPFDKRRNKNVVVIGGSGSGKTRFFVKPNMLQMNASFVCTDPKGTIINEIGMALKNVGKYKIKVFNTVNFDQSMRYNPLRYVKTEQDILKLVETIIVNTTGEKEQHSDSF